MPDPEQPALEQSVIDLVIAARELVFSDHRPIGSPETLAEVELIELFDNLDKATEQFSERIPWDNEPEDASPQPALPADVVEAALQVLNDAHFNPGQFGDADLDDVVQSAIERVASGHAALIERVRVLEEENARLRKYLLPEWFYLAGDMSSDCCRDSVYEVIDQDWLGSYPLNKSGVVQIETATRCPDIWCAVRFFTEEEKDARDSDDDYEITEHATEEEACQALGASNAE